MIANPSVPNFRPFGHMRVPALEAAAGAARAEDNESDEDKKKREDEEAKAKKAEEDEQKRKDEEAKAKKAEEDEEEARRAKKAEDDKDDKKDKEAADERRRIKAILTSASGVRFPKSAQGMAFDGSLSASDAIGLLDAIAEDKATAAQSAPPALADRMATVITPAVGAGDVARGAGPTLAAQIIAAGKKARGEI